MVSWVSLCDSFLPELMEKINSFLVEMRFIHASSPARVTYSCKAKKLAKAWGGQSSGLFDVSSDIERHYLGKERVILESFQIS